MFPLTIAKQFLILVFFILNSSARGRNICGTDRKITCVLNPGLDRDSNDTLVYIKAEGPKDTIHQIWDFSLGIPTMIYAVAGLDSTLEVIYGHDKLDFRMSEEPSFSFGLCIENVYEYNDRYDLGRFDDRVPHAIYVLKQSQWTRMEMKLNETEAMVKMRSKKIAGGHLEVKFDLIPFLDYSVNLPHLIHSSNSSLVEVSMVNLIGVKDFKSSRFALQMLLVSSDNMNSSMYSTVKKSLDDEHTPGVFEVVQVMTPDTAAQNAGYMQYRPVAYTKPHRCVSDSTPVHISRIHKSPINYGTALRAFFSHLNRNYVLAQSVFISFGQPGDGFYKQYNYTGWSFTVGYGAPIFDAVSPYLAAVIAFVVMFPFLLLVCCMVHLAVISDITASK